MRTCCVVFISVLERSSFFPEKGRRDAIYLRFQEIMKYFEQSAPGKSGSQQLLHQNKGQPIWPAGPDELDKRSVEITAQFSPKCYSSRRLGARRRLRQLGALPAPSQNNLPLQSTTTRQGLKQLMFLKIIRRAPFSFDFLLTGFTLGCHFVI